MKVDGITLRRGLKRHSWYGRIVGVSVELVPVLGRNSGKPIAWNARIQGTHTYLGHQSNTLKLMIQRAREEIEIKEAV